MISFSCNALCYVWILIKYIQNSGFWPGISPDPHHPFWNFENPLRQYAAPWGIFKITLGLRGVMGSRWKSPPKNEKKPGYLYSTNPVKLLGFWETPAGTSGRKFSGEICLIRRPKVPLQEISIHADERKLSFFQGPCSNGSRLLGKNYYHIGRWFCVPT